jgi:hypothetical protein
MEMVACLENALLRRRSFASWRRALGPRQHGVAWIACMEAWSWLGDAWVVTMFMQGEWTQWSTWLRRIDGVFGGL